MTAVFHLINPAARHRAWVGRLLKSQSLKSPWALVAKEHPQHTETLVDWALKENVKQLVVWGGDGTFHRVVRALWKRQALDQFDLCLVPVGTCNDLSRHFGLKRKYWQFWDAAAAPKTAKIMLGAIDWPEAAGEKGAAHPRDIFVNNAGFGRSRASFVNKDTPWKTLGAFQPIRIKAQWDAGRLTGLYYMVLACRAPYFSGGLYFEKRMAPASDQLNLYFVAARSKARLAAKFIFGRLGGPLFDGKTTKVMAHKITLDTEAPVWPQTDGEPPPESGVRQVQFEVLSESIRVGVFP